MIVNVRGTSGSGKSMLVRTVRDQYPFTTPYHISGRKQPIRYLHEKANHRSLTVIGHYETACGGCDTVSGMDYIYELIHDAVGRDEDVIFEGLIVASDVKRCINLMEISQLLVIELNTPLEECVAGIQSRRDERGDDRILNPKNTISKMRAIEKQRSKWRAAGVDFRLLTREAALMTCFEVLIL
jgi:adenylate kinase family enzyme